MGKKSTFLSQVFIDLSLRLLNLAKEPNVEMDVNAFWIG